MAPKEEEKRNDTHDKVSDRAGGAHQDAIRHRNRILYKHKNLQKDHAAECGEGV